MADRISASDKQFKAGEADDDGAGIETTLAGHIGIQ